MTTTLLGILVYYPKKYSIKFQAFKSIRKHLFPQMKLKSCTRNKHGSIYTYFFYSSKVTMFLNFYIYLQVIYNIIYYIYYYILIYLYLLLHNVLYLFILNIYIFTKDSIVVRRFPFGHYRHDKSKCNFSYVCRDMLK